MTIAQNPEVHPFPNQKVHELIRSVQDSPVAKWFSLHSETFGTRHERWLRPHLAVQRLTSKKALEPLVFIQRKGREQQDQRSPWKAKEYHWCLIFPEEMGNARHLQKIQEFLQMPWTHEQLQSFTDDSDIVNYIAAWTTLLAELHASKLLPQEAEILVVKVQELAQLIGEFAVEKKIKLSVTTEFYPNYDPDRLEAKKRQPLRKLIKDWDEIQRELEQRMRTRVETAPQTQSFTTPYHKIVRQIIGRDQRTASATSVTPLTAKKLGEIAQYPNQAAAAGFMYGHEFFRTLKAVSDSLQQLERSRALNIHVLAGVLPPEIQVCMRRQYMDSLLELSFFQRGNRAKPAQSIGSDMYVFDLSLLKELIHRTQQDYQGISPFTGDSDIKKNVQAILKILQHAEVIVPSTGTQTQIPEVYHPLAKGVPDETLKKVTRAVSAYVLGERARLRRWHERRRKMWNVLPIYITVAAGLLGLHTHDPDWRTKAAEGIVMGLEESGGMQLARSVVERVKNLGVKTFEGFGLFENSRVSGLSETGLPDFMPSPEQLHSANRPVEFFSDGHPQDFLPKGVFPFLPGPEGGSGIEFRDIVALDPPLMIARIPTSLVSAERSAKEVFSDPEVVKLLYGDQLDSSTLSPLPKSSFEFIFDMSRLPVGRSIYLLPAPPSLPYESGSFREQKQFLQIAAMVPERARATVYAQPANNGQMLLVIDVNEKVAQVGPMRILGRYVTDASVFQIEQNPEEYSGFEDANYKYWLELRMSKDGEVTSLRVQVNGSARSKNPTDTEKHYLALGIRAGEAALLAGVDDYSVLSSKKVGNAWDWFNNRQHHELSTFEQLPSDLMDYIGKNFNFNAIRDAQAEALLKYLQSDELPVSPWKENATTTLQRATELMVQATFEEINTQLSEKGVVYSANPQHNNELTTHDVKTFFSVAEKSGLDCDGLALIKAMLFAAYQQWFYQKDPTSVARGIDFSPRLSEEVRTYLAESGTSIPEGPLSRLESLFLNLRVTIVVGEQLGVGDQKFSGITNHAKIGFRNSRLTIEATEGVQLKDLPITREVDNTAAYQQEVAQYAATLRSVFIFSLGLASLHQFKKTRQGLRDRWEETGSILPEPVRHFEQMVLRKLEPELAALTPQQLSYLILLFRQLYEKDRFGAEIEFRPLPSQSDFGKQMTDALVNENWPPARISVDSVITRHRLINASQQFMNGDSQRYQDVTALLSSLDMNVLLKDNPDVVPVITALKNLHTRTSVHTMVERAMNRVRKGV